MIWVPYFGGQLRPTGAVLLELLLLPSFSGFVLVELLALLLFAPLVHLGRGGRRSRKNRGQKVALLNLGFAMVECPFKTYLGGPVQVGARRHGASGTSQGGSRASRPDLRRPLRDDGRDHLARRSCRRVFAPCRFWRCPRFSAPSRGWRDEHSKRIGQTSK